MDKTRRTLLLRREALIELTAGDLGLIAGGEQQATLAKTCPALECVGGITQALSCSPTCGYTGCCQTATSC